MYRLWVHSLAVWWLRDRVFFVYAAVIVLGDATPLAVQASRLPCILEPRPVLNGLTGTDSVRASDAVTAGVVQ